MIHQPVNVATEVERPGPHIELNVLNEKSEAEERPPRKKGCINVFKKCKNMNIFVSILFSRTIFSLEEDYSGKEH